MLHTVLSIPIDHTVWKKLTGFQFAVSVFGVLPKFFVKVLKLAQQVHFVTYSLLLLILVWLDQDKLEV